MTNNSEERRNTAGPFGWRHASRWLTCWCSALLLGLALRAGSGSEVAVVYNKAFSRDSRRVAEHYAKQRRVPENQVIGLRLPKTEQMTRKGYEDHLRDPLLRELQDRGLLRFGDVIVPAQEGQPGRVLRLISEVKIRYLVLCYGVPLKIARDAKLAEPRAEKLQPTLQRNEAAVDTELALLPLAHQDLLVAGPIRNPFHGVTDATLIDPRRGAFMVARLDGPNAKLAKGLVDKALEAEKNGLWGRAYFDARGLTAGGYLSGDEWIRSAYETTRAQGIESLLDNGPKTFPASFPMPQIALYAGWYDTKVTGPFTREDVEFMPGAIPYHLYSFSARTVRSTSSWVGTFIAKGATATMGSVHEPYLQATPDLSIFFDRLLTKAFTFGEAAYACQNVLSWQNTIIGDPLYRPFGQAPALRHEELQRRGSRPELDWSYLQIVNLNLEAGRSAKEMVTYLEGLKESRTSAVLQQKLGDLHVSDGDLESAVEGYRRALRQNPSPSQRIHLQLGLARMLADVSRAAEALAVYDRFFRENAKYPDLLSIYERALPVAQAANDRRLIARYEREIERLTPPPPKQTNAPAKKP